jgi:hypothetical protein
MFLGKAKEHGFEHVIHTFSGLHWTVESQLEADVGNVTEATGDNYVDFPYE